MKEHTGTNINGDMVSIPKAEHYVFQDEKYDVSFHSNKCTIIKLVEGHPAIDFVIVDDTRISREARNVFLVQASVTAYDKRTVDRRYSSIREKYIGEQSVLDYYKSKTRTSCQNVYYLYVTSTLSSNINDGNPVYIVVLDM